jgi:hypothetical protein
MAAYRLTLRCGRAARRTRPVGAACPPLPCWHAMVAPWPPRPRLARSQRFPEGEPAAMLGVTVTSKAAASAARDRHPGLVLMAGRAMPRTFLGGSLPSPRPYPRVGGEGPSPSPRHGRGGADKPASVRVPEEPRPTDRRFGHRRPVTFVDLAVGARRGPAGQCPRMSKNNPGQARPDTGTTAGRAKLYPPGE